MNIYKGLRFLHGYINPANVADFSDQAPRLHYGARTAANDIAPELGNRAASRRRFGAAAKAIKNLPEVGCITGGCG